MRESYYKYRQTVIVTSGFFRGCQGVLLDCVEYDVRDRSYTYKIKIEDQIVNIHERRIEELPEDSVVKDA